MLVVHFHRETGEIGAWGTGDSESSHLADHAILRLNDHVAIDKALHKVAGGRIVDKAPVERLAALLPIARAAIAAELAATDHYILRPEDRPPLPPAERAAWIAYRQALRDLKGDAGAIVRGWPARPDGVDRTAQLRNALTKAGITP